MHLAAERSVLAGCCLKFVNAHRALLLRLDGVLDVDALMQNEVPRLVLKLDRKKTGPHRVLAYLEKADPDAASAYKQIIGCVKIEEVKPILG